MNNVTLPPRRDAHQLPASLGQATQRTAHHARDVKLQPRADLSPANREALRHAAPSLSAAVGPRASQQANQQEEGKGKSRIGQARPQDPSYYTQFSQSVALPKRDVQSQEKQHLRRTVDRGRSMSM